MHKQSEAYDSNYSLIGTGLLEKQKTLHILAVEDDRLAMEFLRAQIADLGHHTLMARDGEEALNILKEKKEEIDIVMMDREMPVMDGLTAVRQMKNSPVLRRIPVIMVTGADTPEDMREGIEAGVFYYLTKPVNEEIMRSVLLAAAREAHKIRTLDKELRQHRTSFNLIDTCKFSFKTLSDAECLSAFMAQFFPNPGRVLTGLGELMINAVEHGNLGIGYDMKTELVQNNIWRMEVDRRQKLEEHRYKSAEAVIARKTDGIYVEITDQGAGFSWRDFLKIDMARAADNHGRGIARANAVCFDRLDYNEKGNRVVAFVGSDKKSER